MGLAEPEVHNLLQLAGESGHGLAKRNYALVQLMVQAGLVGEVAALRIADITVHGVAAGLNGRPAQGLHILMLLVARIGKHPEELIASRRTPTSAQPCLCGGGDCAVSVHVNEQALAVFRDMARNTTLAGLNLILR
jgi:hypothetical protein